MSIKKRIALKVILCGDYGVGKSSIFRRFVFDSFMENSDRKSTLGFDHYEKTFQVDGKEITLQLWDTGGLERVASVTSSYYKYADGAILVFSYDGWESFSSLSQHVIETVASAENARLFLCGNKRDLIPKHMLEQNSDELTTPSGDCPSSRDVERFFDENRISELDNMFSGRQFFKISCKTGQNVHEMFEQIAQILATNWKSVKLPSPDHFKLHAPSHDQESGCCSHF